jgi:predicted nuclease of predicted toxin-antitoxin system
MQTTANSDPKVVKVRSGNVSAERIRERLTEESAWIISP